MPSAGEPGRAVRAGTPPETGRRSRPTPHQSPEPLLGGCEFCRRAQGCPKRELLIGREGDDLFTGREYLLAGLSYGHGADVVAHANTEEFGRARQGRLNFFV